MMQIVAPIHATSKNTKFFIGLNLNIKFIELRNIPQEAKLSVIWAKDNRNPALSKFVKLLDAENTNRE